MVDWWQVAVPVFSALIAVAVGVLIGWEAHEIFNQRVTRQQIIEEIRKARKIVARRREEEATP